MLYDPRAGQYRSENGRFVKRAIVIALVDREADALGDRLKAKVKAAINGKINAAELAIAMNDDIKTVSIQLAAIAKGGVKRLTLSDYGTMGAIQRERNKRLRGFIGSLRRGDLTERQALQRAEQYANSVKLVHSTIEHSEQSTAYNQARRILSLFADHCPECIRYQTDWTDSSNVVPVGVNCSCRQNCKCSIFYRNLIG